MTRSFSDYLAGRKHPFTTWGDLCRYELKRGTFPNIATWVELRKFVESYPGLRIDIAEARAAWNAYRSMLKKTRVKETSDGPG